MKNPLRIGLVAGARGPNDNQFAWMLAELKRIVASEPVELIACRNLGNAPSWVKRRPLPQGVVVIKDDLPNWKPKHPLSGAEGVVSKLVELDLDLVWCFAGEGQTAFGSSVGSQVYRYACSHLPHQVALHYKLIKSWVLVDEKPNDKDSLKKPRQPKLGDQPWLRSK